MRSGVILAAFWTLPAVFGQLTPNSNLPTGFQPTPQFVSGKVVMADGAALPGRVPIERVCGGVAHVEGYADDRGGFGFEMGHDDMVQDATYNGGAIINPNRPVVSKDVAADPNRPYRECEIRANLLGYHSDSILLATYKPSENSNIGTIILHKMGDVSGTVISATTAAAPRNAAKEYAKGLDEVKKAQPADAVQSFRKAVDLYPQFSAAWLELGKVQMGLQQLADAQKSFEAAMKAEPKFINPYLQLSQLAFRAQKWQELADVTDQVLKLDAFDFPQQYYYNGLANYTLQRMEPAEKSLREAVKLDGQNQYPKSHEFLAAILVTKKEFGAAEEELRSYLKFAPAAQDADKVRSQLAGLEKITRSDAGK